MEMLWASYFSCGAVLVLMKSGYLIIPMIPCYPVKNDDSGSGIFDKKYFGLPVAMLFIILL
jgi:hypothetical protein